MSSREKSYEAPKFINLVFHLQISIAVVGPLQDLGADKRTIAAGQDVRYMLKTDKEKEFPRCRFKMVYGWDGKDHFCPTAVPSKEYLVRWKAGNIVMYMDCTLHTIAQLDGNQLTDEQKKLFNELQEDMLKHRPAVEQFATGKVPPPQMVTGIRSKAVSQLPFTVDR